jgi:hypothetical protein
LTIVLILYQTGFQDNNVVMGKLPGMKVDRCGCS